jgi:hypothetical protein
MREFGSSIPTKNVKEVAQALLSFIIAPYNTQFGTMKEKPALGFFVAGYSQNKVFAEEWEFVLPSDETPAIVRPETGFGASWRGINLPFTRLYKGFDFRIEAELRKLNVWNDSVEKIFKSYESPVAFDGMPVQDALNFAVFIVRTTIGMATFEVGAPTCGGPLQVATILPDSGFEWVVNPQISVRD